MIATVIVDHYSDHTYIYLMRELTLVETLMAKHAHEKFLASLGIKSKAYHADNGQFADKGLEMVVLQTINLLLSVVLAVIIKMESLREKSRILHSVDKLCCFMQTYAP
jgi:hypothetical protein